MFYIRSSNNQVEKQFMFIKRPDVKVLFSCTLMYDRPTYRGILILAQYR